MITDYDSRVNNGDFEEFKQVARKALKHIKENFMEYAQPPRVRGYTYTFSPYSFRDAFDKLISPNGFEIDARTLRHAHGIGNNKEWDVVDKNMNKVGEFSANNNMYQGVYINVSVNGELLDRFEICSGGFIRD